MKPLLALVMIVKNEASGIAETINSIRHCIDRFTILDTGSTDGTRELAREALSGLPGELVQEPFVDYGATRSRVLELAAPHTEFALMLSGDETVEDGASLRAFCERMQPCQGEEHGAYLVRMGWGRIGFELARLTRCSAGWGYRGATHEVLVKDGAPAPSLKVPRARIVHHVERADAVRKRATWHRDLDILSEELRREPQNARAAFYLAQTLDDLGRPQEALQAYTERVKLGGWPEEVFQALYRRACCAARVGLPWPDVQQLFLEAHAHSPHRAEPLFEIAKHWFGQGNHALAYLFGRRAAEIPRPADDRLFVDERVYDFEAVDLLATSAFYAGALDVGEAALAKALRARPDEPRLLRACWHYAQRRSHDVEGWFSDREGWLALISLRQSLRQSAGAVVEVGSYRGRSTVVLASGLRALGATSKVTAIDPLPGTKGELSNRSLPDSPVPGPPRGPDADLLMVNLRRAQLEDHVEVIRARSFEVAWSRPISFLLVDAIHDFENVSRDHAHFAPWVLPGGRVAFHDYSHGFPDVPRFVDALVAAGNYRLVAHADGLAVVERGSRPPPERGVRDPSGYEVCLVTVEGGPTKAGLVALALRLAAAGRRVLLAAPDLDDDLLALDEAAISVFALGSQGLASWRQLLVQHLTAVRTATVFAVEVQDLAPFEGLTLRGETVVRALNLAELERSFTSGDQVVPVMASRQPERAPGIAPAASPRKAILFCCYRGVEVCASRVRHLRALNPELPIFVLFGGAPEDAEAYAEAMTPFVNDFYVATGQPDPFLRWLQSDLIVVEWFERRGHGLSWDSVALVHWDLLLAEPLEEVLPDLAFGQLYFSGLRTIDAALESAWVWTSRPPNRSSYLRFREQLAALGHRGAPLACIFMFSVLTRDFLLKYQRDSRLFSGLNEYKLPSLARHYGLPIMEKDLGVLWDPLEDRADAPMNAINRPISRQFVSTQLARKGGWRVFHPFIEPWEASDHPRRSDAP